MAYVLLALLLVAVIVAAVLVQKRAGAARARIDAGLAELDVLRQDKANCFGRESGGASQVRSLGALALTPDQLVFFHYVPAVDLHIPRAAITGVELTSTFMDKTHNKELLVVTWTSSDGGPAEGDAGGVDRAGFDVADAAEWRADLAHDAGGVDS